MTSTAPRWAAAIAVISVSLACTSSLGRRDVPPAESPAPAARPKNIEHLTPRRDSTGAAPARFEWTAVEGADTYVIGLWTEVDTLVWRQHDVPEASVPLPKDIVLEPGTYFWSVVALRGDRPVAESGFAAFVVLR